MRKSPDPLQRAPHQVNLRARNGSGYARLHQGSVFLVSRGQTLFRPGAYRLEIISAGLLGSGTVHSIKNSHGHQFSVTVN